MNPSRTAPNPQVVDGADAPRPFVAIPIRRPGRWLGIAASLLFAAWVAKLLLTNPTFQWDVVWKYLFDARIMHGLVVTFYLTAAAMVLGITLGVVVAVMRMSPSWLVAWVAYAYVWFFRGTPTLVQLYFWFNLAALVPTLSIGVPFGGPTIATWSTNTVMVPFLAAVIALGLSEAAYYAEIIRAGILSIDAGQITAAQAFGLTRLQTLQRIVFPQAMRVVIPPTGNAVISMLKYTSLASIISVQELMQRTKEIYAVSFEVIPLLLVASLWYLFVVSVLSVGQHFLERRFSEARPSRKTMGRPDRATTVGKESLLTSPVPHAGEGR